MNRNQLFLFTLFAILLGMVIELTFFMREVKAQTTIVLGPNGELVGQIITLPPPPTWR